jgi:hypothetical protein
MAMGSPLALRQNLTTRELRGGGQPHVMIIDHLPPSTSFSSLTHLNMTTSRPDPVY